MMHVSALDASGLPSRFPATYMLQTGLWRLGNLSVGGVCVSFALESLPDLGGPFAGEEAHCSRNTPCSVGRGPRFGKGFR